MAHQLAIEFNPNLDQKDAATQRHLLFLEADFAIHSTTMSLTQISVTHISVTQIYRGMIQPDNRSSLPGHRNGPKFTLRVYERVFIT